jgi:hypothetical protein
MKEIIRLLEKDSEKCLFSMVRSLYITARNISHSAITTPCPSSSHPYEARIL